MNVTNKNVIEEFLRSWDFARGLTLDYVACVPDQFWNFSFHEKYSPLAKQFRHIIWVTGLYTDALETGKLNMANKKLNYSGGLERRELTEALKASDQKLKAWLEKMKTDALDQVSISAFGVDMGFTEYSHLLLQHESNHHGLWSVYAKMAGFETPKSWKESWGL
jgi:hypothetical protein